MYTQCPDCETAFPVTARVLQQAAGQVRCGRCGHPFNALERLSEEPPQSGGHADARSAPELEALEALAGSDDIRIEDTGVEWRVIDDDHDAPDAGAAGDDETDRADRSAVRWYIEEDGGREAAGNDAAISGADEDEAPRHEREKEGLPAQAREQQALQLPPGGDEGELRFDDNTPLPDDFGEDVEPAEPPRRRAEDFIEPPSPEFDERQVDLALGDPGDWMALLDELGTGTDEPASGNEPSAAGDAGSDAADLEDTDIRYADDMQAAEAEKHAGDFPRDIDTQFDLQAVEMGIELTGSHALAGADEDEDEDDQDEWTLADDADASEVESATGPVGREVGDADALELRLLDDEPAELESATDTDADPRDASASDDVTEGPDRTPGPGSGNLDELPPELAKPSTAQPAGAGVERDAGPAPAPLTEEELTLNRLIDQDLMRFAEEQDALASSTSDAHKTRARPHVETIIMEGEFVRTALEDDADEPAAPETPPGSEAGQDVPPALLDSPSAHAVEPHAERRSRKALGGVLVLAVLLIVQVVHAYRETLATNGLFERTAAPVYRILGIPLVPHWNARGWQFQETSGGTNTTGDVLSISSRIANESARPLPYPLIYLSLTDRWEEPVGASVLEPVDYLAADTNATTLVPSGESFTASITIRSLSPDASGFKLNVCYPAGAGKLRCAIEDFRK